MALVLVTGHRGEAHVTSAQAGLLNAGAFGTGRYVLGVLGGFALTVSTATSVTVASGAGVMDGRLVVSESAVTLAVPTVSSATDFWVGVYYHLTEEGVESAQLACSRDESDGGRGDVLAGDATALWPLWKVPATASGLGTPVCLFQTAAPLASKSDVGHAHKALTIGGANWQYYANYDGASAASLIYPEIRQVYHSDSGTTGDISITAAGWWSFGLVSWSDGDSFFHVSAIPTPIADRSFSIAGGASLTASEVVDEYMECAWHGSEGAWTLHREQDCKRSTSGGSSVLASLTFKVYTVWLVAAAAL